MLNCVWCGKDFIFDLKFNWKLLFQWTCLLCTRSTLCRWDKCSLVELESIFKREVEVWTRCRHCCVVDLCFHFISMFRFVYSIIIILLLIKFEQSVTTSWELQKQIITQEYVLRFSINIFVPCWCTSTCHHYQFPD